MSSLVILFAVMRGSDAVCVCGEIVELCGSLMRIFGHVLTSRSENERYLKHKT